MRVLGLVPARGGSKGIARKNLRVVAGKPLIQYTFDAAFSSGVLDHVIVSTDDEEIAGYARTAGADVPFLRPAELAKDETPMLPVILHVLASLDERSGPPDAVVLLQPTSPLRTGAHIRAAVELLEASGADSVVSVVRVPHNFHPISVLRVQDGRLVPFLAGEGTRVLRRQDKPEVFARNGAAVYAVRRETLTEKQSLFGDDCRPLVMDEEASVDVDSDLELTLVEAILSRRQGSTLARSS